MRILHVNKYFELRDGATNYMHRVMQEQQRRGHEVSVLATRGPKDEAAPTPSAFVKHRDLRVSGSVLQDLETAVNFVWNREAEQEMAQLIESFCPDVIHLHNIYHHLSTSILKPIREKQIPCVQTLHDLKLACPNYLMFTEGKVCERCKGGKYAEAITHRCLTASMVPNILAAMEMGLTKTLQSYEQTVHTFICPSRFFQEKFIAWGESAKQLTVLQNPAEVSIAPASVDGAYLLFAARLSKEKGAEVLIDAAKFVPEVQIQIAGIGPQEAVMRERIKEQGIENVEFLGFQRSAELSVIRQRARALVMPSIWYENSPLTVLEAMGEGVPVIASDIGGLPELVFDGATGWLVSPNDPRTLARALQDAWDSSLASRKAMGHAAREEIRRAHDWGRHLDRLDEIYLGSMVR